MDIDTSHITLPGPKEDGGFTLTFIRVAPRSKPASSAQPCVLIVALASMLPACAFFSPSCATRLGSTSLTLPCLRNTVPERQAAFQADARPVFQRLPRSRLYMGVYLAIFGVGMYGTIGGFWNMAHVSCTGSTEPGCLQMLMSMDAHRERKPRRSRRACSSVD